jgi:hypothetical protein
MATLVAIEPSLFHPDREAWFVFDDGRRYLRATEPREPCTARSSFPTPMIRNDNIDPVRGMDGKMHDSLSGLRRTYRADGNPQGENYTEIGNEEIKPVVHQFDRGQRRDDIKAAIEDVKNGRLAPPPVILEDL